MATIQDENNVKEELKKLLQELLDITPKSLIKKISLGEDGFNEWIPYFERILNLFGELKVYL